MDWAITLTYMLGVVGLGRAGKVIVDGTNGMTSSITVDPRRYHELVQEAPGQRIAPAGLPLLGSHKPLQLIVHDLSPHVRGPRTTRRPELGSVHAHRRSGPGSCPCCSASLLGAQRNDLPRMVKYLQERGVYVLFKTTGRCTPRAMAAP